MGESDLFPLRPFGLVLHHDGRWTHQGHPILNRKIREVFDRSVRFLPDEERFVAYPLPTLGIYTRDIIFIPGGGICSASSPTPVMPSVVEGGTQEVICLYPGDPAA